MSELEFDGPVLLLDEPAPELLDDPSPLPDGMLYESEELEEEELDELEELLDEEDSEDAEKESENENMRCSKR